MLLGCRGLVVIVGVVIVSGGLARVTWWCECDVLGLLVVLRVVVVGVWLWVFLVLVVIVGVVLHLVMVRVLL